jgi:hypothetical protein
MTTTIRVSAKTRDLIHELARSAGVPMQEIVEQALEQYRRQQVLAATNVAYAALRDDPQAAQEWQDEQDVWDDTLADGLEDA